MGILRHLFLCLCVLGIVFPMQGTAQAYRAFNLLTVVPLNATDFEVIEARGEGARGMWCAAADYAIHALRVPREQRLYVKTPRGRSISGAGRIGVVFTVDVNALGVSPSRSYSVTVRTAGLSLPLHHAYQFCRDYELELEDIFYPRIRR
ncbi:hypothetical protein AB2B41_07505 [Marimonas sp. MJW-29]|uniref:Uncharacterized protein n=1 Tax=Sulfitobacter sediminis TaxID=3234186 RepID=A0ABV3RLL4_9RHOB